MKFSLISVLFISVIALPMDSSVEGQFQQSASILQGKKKSRLFNKVKTLWEGHKIGKKSHLFSQNRFCYSVASKQVGGLLKFRGLLRKAELYKTQIYTNTYRVELQIPFKLKGSLLCNYIFNLFKGHTISEHIFLSSWIDLSKLM